MTNEKRGCTVEDCAGEHKARGYCAIHYWRFMRSARLRKAYTRDLSGLPYGGGAPCMCGCGELTKFNRSQNRPAKYINGHQSRIPLEQAFWSKVNKTASCWIWTGRVSRDGYGMFDRWVWGGGGRRRTHQAHRLAYELTIGTIPDSLQLDHLCRVRRCVNPSHLEPVTPAENIRRGHVARGTRRAS